MKRDRQVGGKIADGADLEGGFDNSVRKSIQGALISCSQIDRGVTLLNHWFFKAEGR